MNTDMGCTASIPQWCDSIVLLKKLAPFVGDTAVGSIYRGWHEHDPGAAERELRGAAEAGDAHLKRKLAQRLIDGDGLVQDPQAGLALLKEIATSDPIAMERLAAYHFQLAPSPGSRSEGEHWLRKASALRYSAATIALAVRLLTGNGMTADLTQGKQLLADLASTGDRMAHIKLGVYLLAGRGLKPNREEGLGYLRRIGAIQAQQLSSVGGYLYLKSLSLTPNERREWAAEAAALFLEAIQQGNVLDELNLIYLIRRGEIDDAGYATLDTLLAPHLKDGNPFAVINEALRLAGGVQYAADWQAADGLVEQLSDADPILTWWHARALEGDSEGHLVTAWLCRHQLAADPDKLTLPARMALARRGGWEAAPSWMDGFPGHGAY
jgi:Sel1 repeat